MYGSARGVMNLPEVPYRTCLIQEAVVWRTQLQNMFCCQAADLTSVLAAEGRGSSDMWPVPLSPAQI